MVTRRKKCLQACKGRQSADAKSARPPCFVAMIYGGTKQDFNQKNKTDWQTPLTSMEQHTRLESVRQQSPERARNQPHSQVQWRIEDGLILSHTERSGVGIRYEDLMIDNQSARHTECSRLKNVIVCGLIFSIWLWQISETALLNCQRPFDHSRLNKRGGIEL